MADFKAAVSMLLCSHYINYQCLSVTGGEEFLEFPEGRLWPHSLNTKPRHEISHEIPKYKRGDIISYTISAVYFQR